MRPDTAPVSESAPTPAAAPAPTPAALDPTALDPAVETAAREILSSLLVTEVAPDTLDLDATMADAYGLTSLNKVLFLTSLCDETGVDLAHFTEHDLAGMRTLREVVTSLTRHTPKAA
ncbi:acyl carrier protein [Streptomyces sp. URMC 123]|uniref:acyl carrier protein n=1 Tax=Streptomyces sp. URMC 123 TaxID=3423403 RepID=UPI003F1CF166